MFGTQRQHPSKEMLGGIVVVPTVAADLVTVDTFLKQIICSNTTAGNLTLTIKDKQGTPRNVIPTVTIAANTSFIWVAPETVKCLGGVNWVASGTGLEAEVFGYLSAH